MALLEKSRLQEIVSKFNGKSVLVVGDLMVDRYQSILARKISREAPVPVGDLQGEKLSLGGAGNLANNIVALGGRAEILGFVGDDPQGEWIRKALSEAGVEISGIETFKRPTTLKTRYVVNGFQVLRVDREIRSDIDFELSDRLLKHADAFIAKSDLVAIADYDKGTVTSYLIDALVASAKTAGKKIIAQPKVKHYLDFRGVDYVKSNEREASIATGISVLNETGLRNIATNLTTRLGCRAIILTRSERGITVFEQNNMTTIPPMLPPNEFARPVGVRDAMTSVLSLAIASGANAFEGAALSNLAAAIRGQRAGTIVVSSKDIMQNLDIADKIFSQVVQVPVRR
ncbi:MAG: bifunctional ADP-heptose synthase [Thaumarchaeota archaeon]|nr:bifunctional ADP-heptose synthase [Nitrososphaerota archaeon]